MATPWYTPALEMMKTDPAILEMKIEKEASKHTIFRTDHETIILRTECGGFTWTEFLQLKVTLTRSSAVYNLTEEELEQERLAEQQERLATEVAEESLRIKTPPRDDHDAFSTPSPRVRRVEPPRVERKVSYDILPPPSLPLVRSCCSTGTACTNFEGLQTPTLSPPPPPPVARHLFFDDDGEEVSKEEYIASLQVKMEEKEEDDHWFAVKIPPITQPMMARHPRVILAFFRFISYLNEGAEEHEKVKVKPMPLEVFNTVMGYLERHPPPPEFEEEVRELKERLTRNCAAY
jgi:hypothetical protein